MPRRTKLLITSTLLVLLAIPAAYVALTWHVADPFVFRYMGHGEVEMQPADPEPDPSGPQPVQPFGSGEPKVALVPLFFELQNTKNLPINLFNGEVRGERDKGGPPFAGLEWRQGAVPRHGTVRLITYVPLEKIQRLESESFQVYYQTISGTQGAAYDLVWWLRKELYNRFHIDIDPLSLSMDESVTPLIINPAHITRPSAPKATSSP